MKLLEKIITLLILTVTFGGLAVLTLYGSGADSTAVLCVGSFVFSFFIITAAALLYADAHKAKQYKDEFGVPKSLSTDEFIEGYQGKAAFRVGLIVVIAVALVFIALFSLVIGPIDISLSDVVRLLYLHITGYEFVPFSQDYMDDQIIWELRLPRVVVALIAGAGLAIGGAVMQAVVKNPLADPYTTGISSGAMLGASLFIVLGFSITGLGNFGLVANAFIFSLIPAALMIVVSKISNGSPATIILLGTAVSYIFGALNSLIMMLGTEDAMQGAFIWSVGSLSKVTWSTVPVMGFITIVFSAILYMTAGKLNLMMSGDNTAKSLGLNVENYRMICLLIISLITASIVSYLGMIGFVGLIVPHIIRMVIGSDSRLVIPASMLTGAAAMLLADIVARSISSAAVPVGVVLSFVGGPLFLLLVIKSNREAWSD